MANVRKVPAPDWAAGLGVRGPCWIWTGSENSSGYGTIGVRVEGRPHCVPRLVHRMVLHLWFGIPWEQIPVGAHLCGVKKCCSPKHLDAQTHAQNRNYYLYVERPLKAAA